MNIKVRTMIDKSIYCKSEELMLIFYWGYLAFFQRITKTISVLSGVDYRFLDLILWMIILAMSFNDIIRGLELRSFIFLAYVISIFVFSSVIWPNNTLIINNFLPFITTVFPFYFIGKAVVIDEKILVPLFFISKLSILINILVYMFYHTTHLTLGERRDMLGIAYMLLPHVLLIVYLTMKNNNIINVMWSIISSFFLIGLGSRGPILLEMILIVIYFVLKTSLNKKIITCMLGVGMFVIMILLGAYEKLLNYVFTLIKKTGISTRVINAFIMGKTAIFSGSGREEIWQNIIYSIRNNMLLGIGPYGDRLTNIDGFYAHNIMLELLVHFGIIIGLYFIIWIVKSYYQAFKKADEHELVFLWVLLISVIGKLMISATYTADISFFFMVGYLTTFRKKRIERSKDYVEFPK